MESVIGVAQVLLHNVRQLHAARKSQQDIEAECLVAEWNEQSVQAYVPAKSTTRDLAVSGSLQSTLLSVMLSATRRVGRRQRQVGRRWGSDVLLCSSSRPVAPKPHRRPWQAPSLVCAAEFEDVQLVKV